MVVDPTVQRENLVAYVNAGMMTRRRAAEIMGDTLPDPMADVLVVTTGRAWSVWKQSGAERRRKKKDFLNGRDQTSNLDKYSDAQPRAPMEGGLELLTIPTPPGPITMPRENPPARPAGRILSSLLTLVLAEMKKNDSPEEELEHFMASGRLVAAKSHGADARPPGRPQAELRCLHQVLPAARVPSSKARGRSAKKLFRDD